MPPATDPHHHPPHKRRSFLAGLRASFLTGLVVVLPIGLTIYFIWVVTGWIDSWVLPFIPQTWHPDALLRTYLGDNAWVTNIRGVGVVVFLVFTIFVGWIAKGIIGRSFLHWTERTVDRLPVVRSVYNGLKQIAETVFTTGSNTFDKACLVEFPRPGMWSVGFYAGRTRGEVAARLNGAVPMVTVYLPTTPNPTSGYVVFVAEDQVVELDMSFEDAAKLIISAGLVYPPERPSSVTPRPPAQAAE
jgi:uncharacterized membrane protein